MGGGHLSPPMRHASDTGQELLNMMERAPGSFCLPCLEYAAPLLPHRPAVDVIRSDQAEVLIPQASGQDCLPKTTVEVAPGMVAGLQMGDYPLSLTALALPINKRSMNSKVLADPARRQLNSAAVVLSNLNEFRHGSNCGAEPSRPHAPIIPNGPRSPNCFT